LAADKRPTHPINVSQPVHSSLNHSAHGMVIRQDTGPSPTKRS